MGGANRTRAQQLCPAANDFAAIPQGQFVRASALRRCKCRGATTERPGPPVPVLFCRRRMGKNARRANDNCTGRQKIDSRDAGRDYGADTSSTILETARDLTVTSVLSQWEGKFALWFVHSSITKLACFLAPWDRYSHSAHSESPKDRRRRRINLAHENDCEIEVELVRV